MQNLTNRKNKIVLADYDYCQDIENRLFLAQLSVVEAEVLKEIIHSSLTVKIAQLAETLSLPVKSLEAILAKLSESHLFTLKQGVLQVDKERRKYYEFQMEKFEEDFVPDVEYILSSLSKVPIHALPNWYAIPRATDNIYTSIIEKYLITPRTYERYLVEMQLENPVLKGMIEDVFKSPDLRVTARSLSEKYKLSREEFEEYMLLLEYHFVCYLGYTRVDDMWTEVVTPFHEWREYLFRIKKSQPAIIEDDKKIAVKRKDEFAFLQDFNALLKTAQQAPIALTKSGARDFQIKASAITTWLPHLGKEEHDELQIYLQRLLNKIIVLQLGTISDNQLNPSEAAKAWLKKSPQEQAMALYRHPMNKMLNSVQNPTLYSEKNIREIEKTLKKLTISKWVYLEDLLKGIMAPIGHFEGVQLRNKGKNWKYSTPTYNAEELRLIEEVIFERLYETGMIQIGSIQGAKCFCITAFGRLALGD